MQKVQFGRSVQEIDAMTSTGTPPLPPEISHTHIFLVRWAKRSSGLDFFLQVGL